MQFSYFSVYSNKIRWVSFFSLNATCNVELCMMDFHMLDLDRANISGGLLPVWAGSNELVVVVI